MKTTINLLTILMLLSILLTSCGKHVVGKNNSSHAAPIKVQTYSIEHVFLMCSRRSIDRSCLNIASDRKIPVRLFYSRQCYMDYRNCISVNGY